MRNQSLNKNAKLHILYDKDDNHSSDLTLGIFNHLQHLLNEAQETYSFENPMSDDDRENHPLIKIIDSLNTKLLTDWETKRNPIGASFKSQAQIINDLKELRQFDIRNILKPDAYGYKNIFSYFKFLASGLDQYFPEMLDTQTLMKTPIDRLRDKDQFRKIFIEKLLLDGMSTLNKDGSNFCFAFHKCFRKGNFTQTVGNFQPLYMKFIILESFHAALRNKNRFINDRFVIIDPCAGWAGRLCGTLCAFHEVREIYKKRFKRELNVVYICTDPNTKVHDRFNNIIDDWFTHIEPEPETIKYFHFFKHDIGCETPEFLLFVKNSFRKIGAIGAHLAMTSPPYFSQEKYSDDRAQSYLKYPKYESWTDGFLKGMLQNVYELLLPDACFYLNISDVKQNSKIIPLGADAIELSRHIGFNLDETYKIALTTIPKSKTEDSAKFKYEPIYKLRKKEVK
jgi:hypothetical protein